MYKTQPLHGVRSSLEFTLVSQPADSRRINLFRSASQWNIRSHKRLSEQTGVWIVRKRFGQGRADCSGDLTHRACAAHCEQDVKNQMMSVQQSGSGCGVHTGSGCRVAFNNPPVDQ